tara:strand:- start:140836 stop:141081 length:246 start_codon:yes stop_codon:yes gene_type:complete
VPGLNKITTLIGNLTLLYLLLRKSIEVYLKKVEGCLVRFYELNYPRLDQYLKRNRRQPFQVLGIISPETKGRMELRCPING